MSCVLGRLVIAALMVVLMAIAQPTTAQEEDPEIIDFDEDTSDHVGCEFDEIQLASDGIIQLRRLEMGERVAPNTTLNSTVEADDYQFYHLCVMRHEHEHQINVNLTCLDRGTDANLYLSSVEKYPRMGHASWIAQHVGDDHVKLFTYLDGFPRRSDPRHRSIPLHIGVRGVSPLTSAIFMTNSIIIILTGLRMLKSLRTKAAIDDAIRHTKDKVLVLRFGRASDLVCMQQDDVLAKTERELSKMARIALVEADDVPIYCQYFDITLIPATVFFFNAQHIKVDYGKLRALDAATMDCQVIYRGARHGKLIVASPIDRSRIPHYDLLYKDL
ncbi:hypothetical protein P43SY_004913 [Pythium insidiosum]|uniref:Uncharacterized protein n=1 Tax=Pythium insidiosum TaxID=114742 RepID=A0AAD5Q8F9_PYTIN|nr:hypothetical protein P43SY_004913 [Pythium insidiosum]